MASIIIQLDPEFLSNPDLDIRYILPDLLIKKTAGRLIDDGYDYVNDPGDSSLLHIYLRADDVTSIIPEIVKTLASERVLDNDLSRVPIAVDEGGIFCVVHPPEFSGRFLPPNSDPRPQ